MPVEGTCGIVNVVLVSESKLPPLTSFVTSLESGGLSKPIPYLQKDNRDSQHPRLRQVCHSSAGTQERALQTILCDSNVRRGP